MAECAAEAEAFSQSTRSRRRLGRHRDIAVRVTQRGAVLGEHSRARQPKVVENGDRLLPPCCKCARRTVNGVCMCAVWRRGLSKATANVAAAAAAAEVVIVISRSSNKSTGAVL